jgi:hypothetical protein
LFWATISARTTWGGKWAETPANFKVASDSARTIAATTAIEGIGGS